MLPLIATGVLALDPGAMYSPLTFTRDGDPWRPPSLGLDRGLASVVLGLAILAVTIAAIHLIAGRHPVRSARARVRSRPVRDRGAPSGGRGCERAVGAAYGQWGGCYARSYRDRRRRIGHAVGVGDYREQQPTREEIDQLAGPAVLMFGTDWCGYCIGAERYIEPALREHPDVPVVRVEDGRGRPLGRSYRVKLWPTLIFLRDGEERARVVRPTNRAVVDEGLAAITAP